MRLRNAGDRRETSRSRKAGPLPDRRGQRKSWPSGSLPDTGRPTHRRAEMRLVVADLAVAVGVEVHERNAANVRAVVDEVLSDASHERAGRVRVLKLRADFEPEVADQVVDAGRALARSSARRTRARRTYRSPRAARRRSSRLASRRCSRGRRRRTDVSVRSHEPKICCANPCALGQDRAVDGAARASASCSCSRRCGPCRRSATEGL